MASTANLSALDDFVSAVKRVAGYDTPPTWGTGYVPHERQMKYPLLVNGQLSGASLMVICFPRNPEQFRIGILAPGCLARLDYTDEVHSNSLAAVADGIDPIVRGPHYHSWALNRRFFQGVTRPPRLRLATAFDRRGSFDAILRWFCGENGIESLPGHHRIELPRMGQLI